MSDYDEENKYGDYDEEVKQDFVQYDLFEAGNIPSRDYPNHEYEQFYVIDQDPDNQVSILLSRLQEKAKNGGEPIYKKLVNMKVFSKEYLKYEDVKEELTKEINCLRRLRDQTYCLQFVEHLVLDSCEILVTNFIFGDDLFTLRQDEDIKFTEEMGRTIFRKINEAMVSYHSEQYVHRDLHSMNVCIDYPIELSNA